VKMVLFVGLAKSSFLSIQPFAVVHYSAYGRAACRCDFHEVQTSVAGSIYGLVSVNNSDLIV
jgi:hypothetical protein